MQNHACYICHSTKWPVLDVTTGWTFCDSCYHDIEEEYRKGSKNRAEWLRAIAFILDRIDVLSLTKSEKG